MVDTLAMMKKGVLSLLSNRRDPTAAQCMHAPTLQNAVQMEQAGHTHPDTSPPKSRDFNRERAPETPKRTEGETDQVGDSPKPQGDLKETMSRPQPLFPNRGWPALATANACGLMVEEIKLL